MAGSKQNSMWGDHSAQKGWILDCLKSQTQPSVHILSSPTKKERISSQVVTWHTKSASNPTSRPKILFFPITTEGLYFVDNHKDFGGYKLVYSVPSEKDLRYKTVKPEHANIIFQRRMNGESYHQIAASIKQY